MERQQVRADRLTEGLWVRYPSVTPGPWRQIDRVYRQHTYGNPEVVVLFTDGSKANVAPDQLWELDMEIDQ